MNTYKKFSIVIGLLFLSTWAISQDRPVIWVHGLNSDNNFWANLNTIFHQERRMTGTNRTYATGQGILVFANDIISRNAGSTSTIAIGHSMGGVALREINRSHPNFFGGVITFGAPLDGARIVNSYQNGAFGNVILNATNQLVAGPKSQFYTTYVIVNYAVKNNANWGGADLAEIPRRLIMDDLNNLMNGQSATDLAENSTYNSGIKNFYSSIPKINVYGNENAPVMQRIASSSVSDGQNDTDVIQLIDLAKNQYKLWVNSNLAQAFMDPLHAVKYWTRANAWQKGFDYLNSTVESDWANLIGSTRTETTTYTYQDYVCDDGGISNNNQMQRIEPACWQTVTTTYTQNIIEPSDGLIHKSSQTGSKSSWHGTAVEALGVNHMEMGNHAETRRILNNIFDGIVNPSISIPRR